MPNIIQFVEDPKLLGKAFKPKRDVDTFAQWKIVLRLLFSLPLTEQEQTFALKHTGRTVLPADAINEIWLSVGRRGGKSRTMSAIAVYLGCLFGYGDRLAAGEVGVVLLVAADKRQAKILLDYIRGSIRSCSALAKMIVRETTDTIELSNRISIEVRAGSYRTVRGATIVAALVDEAAFLPQDESAEPATELLAAIRPAMATMPEAKLIVSSTPYGQSGPFYQASKAHFGNDSSGIIFFNADSITMNPSLSRRVIDAAFASDPASAISEYGSGGFTQFRADVAAFLSRSVVEATVVKGREELPYTRGVRYFGFVDPSGGIVDSYTLAIAHIANGKAILDVLWERRAPVSPEEVTAEFATLLKAYRISTVTGDAYGGMWPREKFARFGVQYEASELNRSELYLEVLPALMSQQIELPANVRLVDQLCGLQRKTARSGKDSVDHMIGAHDDLSNAAAGALVCAIRSMGSGWFLTANFEDVKGLLTGARQFGSNIVDKLAKLVPSGDGEVADQQEAPPQAMECLQCGDRNLTLSIAGGVSCPCGWRRPLQPEEATRLLQPGAPSGESFTRSAAAQMESAVASDARIAKVFGAPKKNRVATRETRSQAGVVAPSCCQECSNKFLGSTEDRFGNRILTCGSCGWNKSIPPKTTTRGDGRISNS